MCCDATGNKPAQTSTPCPCLPQALAAQQAEERAANEAVFTQARQELTCRWQERMTQMQDQLMLSQQ